MITKILPVKLTPDEERSKGKKAAALGRECGQIHVELAMITLTAKNKKEVLAEKEKAIAELHHQIDSGQEYREVQCEEERDHENLVVYTIRLDTAAVIDTRAFTLDERQVMLPFAAREG